MGAGINLNYGLHSDYKNFGIGVKYQYEFVENVRGEASFNYFFKKDLCTMWDANLNFHYLFHLGEKPVLYPVAGLTLLGTSVDLGAFGSASDTNIGANLGVGFEYPIVDAFKLNAEVKYQLVKDWNRPVISIGAVYNF